VRSPQRTSLRREAICHIARFRFEFTKRITLREAFVQILAQKAAHPEPFVLRDVCELVQEQRPTLGMFALQIDAVAKRHPDRAVETHAEPARQKSKHRMQARRNACDLANSYAVRSDNSNLSRIDELRFAQGFTAAQNCAFFAPDPGAGERQDQFNNEHAPHCIVSRYNVSKFDGGF
jgi:hypothetical protein